MTRAGGSSDIRCEAPSPLLQLCHLGQAVAQASSRSSKPQFPACKMGIRRVPPSGLSEVIYAKRLEWERRVHTLHAQRLHCCHDPLSAAGGESVGPGDPRPCLGVSLTPGVPVHPPFFSSFCTLTVGSGGRHTPAPPPLPGPVTAMRTAPSTPAATPAFGEGQTRGSTVTGCALREPGQEPSVSNTPAVCPRQLGTDSCLPLAPV